MVCVKSFKLLLDEFILQVNHRKVNRSELSFTICLQPCQNLQVSFINCSRKCNKSVIDSAGGVMLIFSVLIISTLNIWGRMTMERPRGLGPMLGRSAHLAKERMDARLSQYDVTPAQTHTLLYLHHHQGQAPQCEVIRHLKVKPSTANGILDRMEEKELLSRSVSSRDARQRLITLTEKGAKLQVQLYQAFHETEELMMKGLSEEERDVFFSCLERVIQNLEEDRSL